MRLKKLFIILILGLVILPVTPALADEVTVGDIAEQIMCQCEDCTHILSECDCGFREIMLAEIEEQLAQGKSEQETIDYFIAKYGEKVLVSPPKSGFNLVAWILPFAAILAGGVVVYLTIKKWVKQGGQSATSAKAEEGDEEYQRRLEKELEEFTKEGFR